MDKRFVFAREERPGDAWLDRFIAGRGEAERWYQGEGRTVPPTAADCRAALGRHMPELLPHYDEACALVGEDDLAHRILSHYRPPPIIGGCSQAVWLGSDGPALVRNYDSRSMWCPIVSRPPFGSGTRSSPKRRGRGVAVSTA
jgi:predicted choloylglycine hydrolase